MHVTGTHRAVGRIHLQERGQAQTRGKRRQRKFYVGPLLILAFLVIEGMLLARIAGQATSQDPAWTPFGTLLAITDVLVDPFRGVQPEPTLKQTGVVEFSTLVAFEAYLIITLALIALIQLVHISAWFVRRMRRSRRRRLEVPEVIVTPQQDQELAA